MTTSGFVELLFLGCLPAVNLYPLIYAFRPWRSTPQGRALMIKALGNLLLVDMLIAHQFLGDYWGRDVIRLIGMALFFCGVWYLLLTLLRSPGAWEYVPLKWFRRGRSKERTHRDD